MTASDRIDLAAHRARVCRALRNSDDPLLREIGEQLGQGSIQPGDLLTAPAYRRLVDTGLHRLSTAYSESPIHSGDERGPAAGVAAPG